jgi:hypothetical protein
LEADSRYGLAKIGGSRSIAKSMKNAAFVRRQIIGGAVGEPAK